MARKEKKVDVKAVAKAEVMAIVAQALQTAGYMVKEGVDFGMTKGTLIVGTEQTDVQIKPITPKAGITRYEIEEEEGE